MDLASEFELSVNRTRGNGYKMVLPRFSTVLYRYFQTVRVCNLWNSILEAVVNARSVDAFKRKMDMKVTKSSGPHSVRYSRLTRLFSLLSRLWQISIVIPPSTDRYVRLASTAMLRDFNLTEEMRLWHTRFVRYTLGASHLVFRVGSHKWPIAWPFHL